MRRTLTAWAVVPALAVGGGLAATPAPASAAAVSASEARAVNNRGDAVGWAFTASGARHAVIWEKFGGSYTAAQDLGTLGGEWSEAAAVNDLGEVVGISLDANGAARAFRWTSGGTMTDIGGLPGSAACEAADINDRGQIVGNCVLPDGAGGYRRHAVLWSGGTVVDLDAAHPSIYDSAAVGLNDRGEVFGTVHGSTAAGLVLWSGGERISLGGTATQSRGDVNDRSEVVGSYSNNQDGEGNLFTPTRWGGYAATPIPALPGGGGTSGAAYDVNERGEVVGISRATGGIHGFVWDQGEMTDVGTLGGPSSYANGINDRGEVVGQAQLADQRWRAFVWSRGTMVDLGTLS